MSASNYVYLFSTVGSGDLPLADQLRKEYLPRISRTSEAIKESLNGKKVAIMCDETTDRRRRAIFAVLARTMEGTLEQYCYLLSVTFLEAVNATTCL